MSQEHQKKPGKSSVTGSSHHDHDHHAPGPGKRTLTEALPHHKSGHGHREADRSEGGPSVKVALVAGKPAKAASAPVPAMEEVKDDPGTEAAPTARAATAFSLDQAVHTYAPVVYMAKKEEYRAANASEYITNSSLKWSHQGKGADQTFDTPGHIDQGALGRGDYSNRARNAQGLDTGRLIRSNEDVRPKDNRGPGGDEGFYLDLPKEHHKSQRSGTDAPVYYEAKNGHYITYWFFYAFNAGPAPGGVDDHEGDWERICVHLDSSNRATEVAYFQHDGPPKVYAWRDVPKEGVTHPVVYSAKGSHASYTSPGSKRLHKSGLPIPVVKDHASKGARWVADPGGAADHLTDVTQQAWYGYGGAWGEPGSITETTGPQGPSGHKKPAPDGW